MANREFISANELYRDAFALAIQIVNSGYRPDTLLVIWRGGTPVGMVVHEFLTYRHIEPEHEVLKVASYSGIEDQAEVRIEHRDLLLRATTAGGSVLVVDDIFDSGRTIETLVVAIGGRASEIRVATPYYKPASNQTDRVPDYYIRTTENWIVFPHEIVGLSADEIRQKGADIARLVAPSE